MTKPRVLRSSFAQLSKTHSERIMKHREKAAVLQERPSSVDKLIDQIFLSDYKNMELFSYSKLRDHQLAETAVQEAFLLALEHYEKFSSSEDPVGWLYEAVRYISLHIFRERQYLLLHTVALSDVPDSSIEHIDTYPLLPREIRESPEMKLLWEFYVAGYSARELAEKYDLELGACKMRIFRARQKLSEQLKSLK